MKKIIILSFCFVSLFYANCKKKEIDNDKWCNVVFWSKLDFPETIILVIDKYPNQDAIAIGYGSNTHTPPPNCDDNLDNLRYSNLHVHQGKHNLEFRFEKSNKLYKEDVINAISGDCIIYELK